MKCPKCGEDMEEEHIFLVSAGYRGALYRSKEEPPDYWAIYPKSEGSIPLLQRNFFHRDKKHWSRKGFRCANCKFVTFEY